MNFFQYLNPSNLPPSARPRNVISIQREIILQTLMNIFLGIASVGMLVIVLFFPAVIRSGHIGYYLLGYAVFALTAIIRRIPYLIRASLLTLTLQMLGAAALLSYGLSGTGIMFVFASVLIANFLFEHGLLTLLYFLLGLGEVITIGFLMVNKHVPLPPAAVMANSGVGSQWFTAALVLFFLMSLLTATTFLIIRGMDRALRASDKLTKELEEERVSLEKRVEERSAVLKKRVDQFEVASEIAREISTETNLESLLNKAANLIREHFNFYHVGIFLNDERNEYAILRAATGEAGRAMLERNHRLKIGEIGIVGFAVSRGEARISMNVASDAVHYKNPLLPDTRSEMALPLRAGERTIGALDVQSVVEDAFEQQDVRILQTISDQLAIAFEKARLVENLQRSMEEMESTTRIATQKAWRTHLRNTRQKLAYRYRDERLENQVEETPQAQEALSKGQSVLSITPGKDAQGQPVAVLAVPIKLRNQVLGVVDIQFQGSNISPDLIALIEGTVNRLAVSLENARLLEEIQYRAERERLVSEISSKVRAASDVDSVLQIAIQEIGRSLGVSEVMVQLRKEA